MLLSGILVQEQRQVTGYHQTQKQTFRPVEQNRRPRHETMLLWPPDFFTEAPKTYYGEKTASSTKTGYLHTENWN
jgi:hypothetical protein